MPELDLSFACTPYDRTRPLMDGRVTIPGCRLSIPDMPIEEMFTKALSETAFDISELSLSNFMRQVAAGTNAYSALPIFTARSFRHSAFYVRSDSGIERPEDLKGKRLGVREYTNTATLVARGMLSDEYGVRAEDVSWLVGDIDEVERDAMPELRLHRPIAIENAAPGQLLDDMLMAGEIDGLVVYKPPRSFCEGHPQVRRLFPDWVVAEQAYFRKTGIFPIMHPMGVRTELLQAEPWLAQAVFDAFCTAKALAEEDLRNMQALKITLPWVVGAYEETVATMGRNFWPYGFEVNRPALESLTRYSFEQGMIAEPLAAEALFHRPSLAFEEKR